MPPSPTFITEALCLVTQVQLLLTTVTVNEQLIQHWLTPVRLVTATHFNSNATPTTDNDCSCCRTCLTNHMEFISRYYIVINSLRGGHTHKHTYRFPHRNNFKKSGALWPQAGTCLV